MSDQHPPRVAHFAIKSRNTLRANCFDDRDKSYVGDAVTGVIGECSRRCPILLFTLQELQLSPDSFIHVILSQRNKAG